MGGGDHETMRILVLGGTHHVGRAIVETALARGHHVTTLTRGISGPPAAGAEARYADRSDRRALRDALGEGTFDAVLDTWSGAPRVVRDSAALLAQRAGHYGYVSTRSVYRWPIPPAANEGAPVVDADPGSADGSDYAAAKRGAEIAVLETFPDTSLLARAGLVLGPYERVGRLPWWLTRIADGGRVVAPGPPQRPLQYLDGRDLAAWMLSAAENGVTGVYDSVSESGHTTTRELLQTCVDVTGSDAELVWATPEELADAGITGWVDLPIWTPPTGELASLHDADVSAAHTAGLRCRPVLDTVRDTWAWLQDEGLPPSPSGRSTLGIDAATEQRILAAVATRSGH